MQESVLEAQVLALAGLLQSAHLVDQIACSGQYAPEQFNPLIQSLFAFDSETTEGIYGGTQNLQLGLTLLTEILHSGSAERDRQSLRYVLGMLHLERKLSNDSELLGVLRNRLEHIQFKSEHFSSENSDLSGSVAAVYRDTISTFKFRIQVNGSMTHLQNEQNADRIRSLLLAGIRAAVLWRQKGGRRWHLFFKRKALLRVAKAKLEQH